MSGEPNNAEHELRELYRAVATERSPERLDDAVRRAADAALTERPRQSRWLPSLALAATLVIAVGVAFRGEFAVEQGTGVAPADSASEAAAEAEPRAAPAAAGAAQALSEELRESAASAADVLEAETFREKARREALSSRSKPAAPDAASDAPVERHRLDNEVAATAFMSDTVTRQTNACDDDERRTPERWRACIEALAERGDGAALAVERAEFTRRHPDITLPPPD
ncbi:MAG: hypothetical protein AAFX58_06030 [Pseudomonadota bacterium]